MNPLTPVGGKNLSSGLKERLKRCGRYHASPTADIPVAKQPTIDRVTEQNKPKSVAKKSLLVCHNAHKPDVEQPSTRQNQIDKQPTQVTVSPDSILKAEKCSNVDDENDSIKFRKRIISHESQNEQNNKKVKLDFQNFENQDEKGIVKSYDVCSRTCVVKSEQSQSSNMISQKDEQADKQQPLTPTLTKNIPGTEQHVCQTLNRQIEPKTPLSSRTVSHNKQIKASKLVFDDKNRLETIKLNESNCDISEGKIVGDMKDTSGIQAKLIKELTVKEDVLRKLRMVKMYRSKNNLTELQTLIDKWRNVSQQALQDLNDAMTTEPKPTLTQLINHLGIQHDLFGFNPNDETFAL